MANNRRLEKLKSHFLHGKPIKRNYIIRMHRLHQYLFAYATFIKDTDIQKIEITDNRIIMTSRNDVKMITDCNDRRSTPIEILNFGAYEKSDFHLLLQLIDTRSTFFDIGANIGFVAMSVFKAIKHVTIFAFEPIPQTFSLLKQNIKLNEVKNIYCYNFGFAEKKKEFSLYYNPNYSGNASFANLSPSPDVVQVTCQLKKLDDFIKEAGKRIDVIKCDVEGAELFVFKGGMKAIEEHKPIIFVEMLRKWTKKFGYNPNATIDLLTTIGYTCYVVNDVNKLIELSRMTEDVVHTNFFFLHKEKHKDKISKYSK